MAVLVVIGGIAVAEEEPAPDMAFLEYLGSWEESDEDWLLFEGTADEQPADDDEERSDPAPEGEESPESKHES